MGLEEEDIQATEEKLKRLRKEGFAEMAFGTVMIHAYLKSRSSTPVPLLPDSPSSNDQLPTLPASLTETPSDDLRILRKDLEEESIRLQLIERFLAEKERSLQVELAAFKRLQGEQEMQRREKEEKVKDRYWQLFEWHKQLETVIIQHASSDLPQFPFSPRPAKSEKRLQQEAELERVRKQVEGLNTPGAGELVQALQKAEEAYYQSLDGSDPHKLAVRLEMVKNKLLTHKENQTLAQSQHQNSTILSSISLLSEATPCSRARKTILHSVLQRSSTRPSSPVRRSAWVSSPKQEESEERSSREVVPDGEEFDKCVKTVAEMERSREQLKELLVAMQEQVKTFKQQEEQETESRLRLKARERRLLQLERDFKSQLSAVKSREVVLAQREDELRVIFSQRMTLPEGEVTKLLGRSAGRVQEQIHALEEKTRELVRLHGDLNQEQSFIQELKRTTERKLTNLSQSQSLLSREKDRLEALAKALDRHFLRLLELSQ